MSFFEFIRNLGQAKQQEQQPESAQAPQVEAPFKGEPIYRVRYTMPPAREPLKAVTPEVKARADRAVGRLGNSTWLFEKPYEPESTAGRSQPMRRNGVNQDKEGPVLNPTTEQDEKIAEKPVVAPSREAEQAKDAPTRSQSPSRSRDGWDR